MSLFVLLGCQAVPQIVQPVDFQVNSDRRPLLTNVDLKLEKFFKIKRSRFSVFLQVENLFDAKNERFVHLSTGGSLNSLEEATNPNRFNNIKKTIQSTPKDFFPVEFLDQFYAREDLLSEPRQILLGLTFTY